MLPSVPGFSNRKLFAWLASGRIFAPKMGFSRRESRTLCCRRLMSTEERPRLRQVVGLSAERAAFIASSDSRSAASCCCAAFHAGIGESLIWKASKSGELKSQFADIGSTSFSRISFSPAHLKVATLASFGRMAFVYGRLILDETLDTEDARDERIEESEIIDSGLQLTLDSDPASEGRRDAIAYCSRPLNFEKAHLSSTVRAMHALFAWAIAAHIDGLRNPKVA